MKALWTLVVLLVGCATATPPPAVFLQTRFADGRVSPVLERSFEVVPPGALKGVLAIPSRIVKDYAARDTEWWVEDARGRVSNKLVQRVVIRD